MAHKHLIYLILSSFILVFYSCNQTKNEDYKALSVQIGSQNFDLQHSGVNKIVVITDKGCPSCTNTLARIALDELADSTTLFYITSKGNNINILPFMELKKNVIFDWQTGNKPIPQLSATGIVYLKNNQIDTIIKINAEEIGKQIEFIKQK